MIHCTEPATPAVIVFCEFPVSLHRTPITVLLKRGEGFFQQLQVESPHALEKSRSKEERPAQAIFRQTQTDASRGRQSALST